MYFPAPYAHLGLVVPSAPPVRIARSWSECWSTTGAQATRSDTAPPVSWWRTCAAGTRYRAHFWTGTTRRWRISTNEAMSIITRRKPSKTRCSHREISKEHIAFFLPESQKQLERVLRAELYEKSIILPYNSSVTEVEEILMSRRVSNGWQRCYFRYSEGDDSALDFFLNL